MGSRPVYNGIDPVTTDSRQRRDEIAKQTLTLQSLSHAGLSQWSDEQLGAYLSGYVDGEGSFHVSLYRRARLRVGWEVRPSFSVCQKRAKSEVLTLMRGYFGCGSIRNCITDDVDHFEVRKIDDLLSSIIPHFEHFPLLSSRQFNLRPFKAICLLVKEGKHLEVEGLREILSLVTQMDVSSRRKHSLDAIAASLNERVKI